LVVAVRSTPVATFLITSFACGIPDPFVSDTVPESVPPATCARVGAEVMMESIRKTAVVRPNEYNLAVF
jgi:hypothetical protein